MHFNVEIHRKVKLKERSIRSTHSVLLIVSKHYLYQVLECDALEILTLNIQV